MEVWECIEKDINRTRSDLNFYSQKTGYKKSKEHTLLIRDKKIKEKIENYEYEETHRDVIARILFVFASTNIGIGYSQGMNEIIAVIYYTLYNCEIEEERIHAEADSFWLFFSLISLVFYFLTY